VLEVAGPLCLNRRQEEIGNVLREEGCFMQRARAGRQTIRYSARRPTARSPVASHVDQERDLIRRGGGFVRQIWRGHQS